MILDHGGADAQGAPRWDFSTNTNAYGPSGTVLDAVRAADASHYPDAAYTELREALAQFHDVALERIGLAASASEFIMRVTGAVVRGGGQRVWLPGMAYSDYRRAADAWGLRRVSEPADANLLWLCEPTSPLGGAEAMSREVASQGGVVVLDRAYEPMRLSGEPSLDETVLNCVWQIWSPNKALGMTGVRGCYVIAPEPLPDLAQTLEMMTPSWPLGAHAVAMLSIWVRDDVQHWLACSRQVLTQWKKEQIARLASVGWTCLPSDANYFCARAPRSLDSFLLRARGIKLRGTGSFGLPDHWRLSVQPPVAQTAVYEALLAQQENRV